MAESENGLTVDEAIGKFVRCHGFPGGLSYYDIESDGVVTPGLSGLVDSLTEGSWYATGYTAPMTSSAVRERIPAHLWEVLKIEPGGIASGGGLEYAGLRFFEFTPAPLYTGKAGTDCERWLIDMMSRPGRRLKDDVMTDALTQFPGLSETAFRQAWEEARKEPTTRPEWRKTGPLRGVRNPN